MSAGGKGSTPRTFSVTPEQFGAAHERIFGVKQRNTWQYQPPSGQAGEHKKEKEYDQKKPNPDAG